jgi:hypothetical protein
LRHSHCAVAIAMPRLATTPWLLRVFASSRLRVRFHSTAAMAHAKNGKGKGKPRNDSRRDAETQKRWDEERISFHACLGVFAA